MSIAAVTVRMPQTGAFPIDWWSPQAPSWSDSCFWFRSGLLLSCTYPDWASAMSTPSSSSSWDRAVVPVTPTCITWEIQATWGGSTKGKGCVCRGVGVVSFFTSGQLKTSMLPKPLRSKSDSSGAFYYQKRGCHFLSAVKYFHFLQAAGGNPETLSLTDVFCIWFLLFSC